MNRSLITEFGLYFIIALSLFSFGAVPHWSYLSISAIVFFLCFVCPDIVSDYQKIHRLAIISAGLLFVWVSVQTLFFSLNINYSIFQIIKWLAGLGIFLLCQKLNRQSLIRVFFFFILMVCLIIAYGFYQILIGHEYILWEKKVHHLGYLTGTFRNRNHFSGLLELASGVVLGIVFRFFEKKKPAYGITFILIFIFMLSAIVATGSRTGLACWFMMLMSFFVFLILSKQSRGLAVVLCLISALAFFVAVYFGWAIFSARMADLSKDLITWEGRVTVWREILTMIPDFLWKGTGLGNFGYAYVLYQSPDILYRWNHAHQDYLELFIEIGLPGSLLMLFTFAGIVLTFLKNSDEKDYTSSVMAAGCGAGCLALMLHGFVDFNFAIPANHFMFLLVLGMGCRILQFQKRKLLVRKDHGERS